MQEPIRTCRGHLDVDFAVWKTPLGQCNKKPSEKAAWLPWWIEAMVYSWFNSLPTGQFHWVSAYFQIRNRESNHIPFCKDCNNPNLPGVPAHIKIDVYFKSRPYKFYNKFLGILLQSQHNPDAVTPELFISISQDVSSQIANTLLYGGSRHTGV